MSKGLKLRTGYFGDRPSFLALAGLLQDIFDIDIALLDLQLPDGSGTDLLEMLGEADTEIVMITGHGSVDSAVDALHRGARDYLTKPIDIAELSGVVTKLAGAKRAGA